MDKQIYRTELGVCPQCEAHMMMQRSVAIEETLGVKHLVWKSKCLDCGVEFSTATQMDKSLEAYYKEKERNV